MFTNATLGIIVCDQPGRTVSVSARAGQLLGYAPAELLGQRIEVLVPDTGGRHYIQLRDSYNADPQVRNMGHNSPLIGRCSRQISLGATSAGRRILLVWLMKVRQQADSSQSSQTSWVAPLRRGCIRATTTQRCHDQPPDRYYY